MDQKEVEIRFDNINPIDIYSGSKTAVRHLHRYGAKVGCRCGLFSRAAASSTSM